MATKGFTITINEDGASCNEGYEIRGSPFVKLCQLIESDNPNIQEICQIIKHVPHPEKPETYIGLKELKLLKKAFNIINQKEVL